MRLLLDTHTALWWMNADRRLTGAARRAIANPGNTRLLSIASAWEMAIKSSLERLKLQGPIDAFLEEQLPTNRIELLAITIDDLKTVETLPFHHRDPFDRMLVAQALRAELTIVSADPVFERYDVKRLW